MLISADTKVIFLPATNSNIYLVFIFILIPLIIINFLLFKNNALKLSLLSFTCLSTNLHQLDPSSVNIYGFSQAKEDLNINVMKPMFYFVFVHKQDGRQCN